MDELVDEGLLPAGAAGQRSESGLAASAPDRLWLLVSSPNVPIEAGAGASIFRGFYEVQDPNGDGDWSDQEVVPITLPSFVGADARTPEEIPWYFWQLIAEPSVGGVDRSRSFLLQMRNLDGEHRVYRVADHNRDGDALDAGEFELVFAGSPAHADLGWVVAPRTVVRDGDVVLRELVIHSYTTATRVSRVTESGEVIDIARAFTLIFSVLADSQGNIYVWGAPPDDFQTTVLYKLKPIPEGERPASQQEATQPAASPEPTAGDIASGVPQIAFTREVSEPGRKSEILLVGVDGSGPTRFLENEHVSGLSRSPGGSRILYVSDEEIPNEFFTYVANADGSNRKKLTEKPADVFCWPSEDWLILSVEAGGSYTPTIYDLKTSQEVRELKELRNATGVAWPACTPVRHHIAFATGIDFSKRPPTGQERLELLNLDTRERRQLDGPLSDRSYLDLRWTPDGRRLGYVVGPPKGYKPPPYPDNSYELYVADLPEGKPRLLFRTDGTIQWFDWSPSGNWLLLHLASGRLCSKEEAAARREDLCDVQRGLVLVNAQSGEAQQVVSGEYFSARWMPTEDAFAYGTGQAVYLVSVNGDVRQVATASEGRCPFCLSQSFGFSPDGRYLGLWNIGGGPGDPGMITIVDIGTGETRVLVEEREGIAIWNPQWWR